MFLGFGRILQTPLNPIKSYKRFHMSSPPYETWSKEDLIARLRSLDAKKYTRKSRPVPPPRSRSPSPPSRQFDFNSHSRRKIALKFCYSGWEYNGLAIQTDPTPLPTVEGVIFDALSRARLIDPAAGFEGCEWDRCGRTDAGVSAAGQVISLWVRSASENHAPSSPCVSPPLPDADLQIPSTTPEEADGVAGSEDSLDDGFGSLDLGEETNSSLPPPQKRELAYVHILNGLLPPTIRILAWSPVSPTFSARFNCKFRHYKYFFNADGLDIQRMQDAASRLVGEHDFRNLCKLDACKQITIFTRRVFRAEIVPIHNDLESNSTQSGSNIYVFNLVGNAFLYNQVRHIMAILFLVGKGFEHPYVVSALMNVQDGMETFKEGDPPENRVVSTKPEYQMADGLPLVLWECGYGDAELNWAVQSKYESASDDSKPGEMSFYSEFSHLYSIYARSQIFTTLNQYFLAAASIYHLPPSARDSQLRDIPLGGGFTRPTHKYTPLLLRKRQEDIETKNERWRAGQGLRRAERLAIANAVGT